MSHDQLNEAKQFAGTINKELIKVDHNLMTEDTHEWWMKNFNDMKYSSTMIAQSENIEQARTSFEKLSNILISVSKQIGSSGIQQILLYHCPMAFDYKGANWLQNKEGTENPYFGSKMFTCGTQEAILTYGEHNTSGGSQNE